MAEINTIVPDVLIHRVSSGGVLTGVNPNVAHALEFDYDNEASGPFTVGESLTWTGGGGVLRGLVDAGTTGSMVVEYDPATSGALPEDDFAVAGVSSSATCDVNGAVTHAFLDSVETIRRGRYRAYSGLANGGLVDIAESTVTSGYSIKNALVTMPGVTDVTFYIVDRSGNSSSAGVITLASGNGYSEWKNNGLLIAPGCKFQAVGTGTLSSDGQIMFIIGGGWTNSMFDDISYMGDDNRPG